MKNKEFEVQSEIRRQLFDIRANIDSLVRLAGDKKYEFHKELVHISKSVDNMYNMQWSVTQYLMAKLRVSKK